MDVFDQSHVTKTDKSSVSFYMNYLYYSMFFSVCLFGLSVALSQNKAVYYSF